MPSDDFTEKRLAELEAKVDHMYRHLTGQVGGTGASIPPMANAGSGVSEAVREAARGGNMVEAIRLQRAETGQSLSEAKDAVTGAG
jgi:ribosomal protein L7/L12